MIQTKLDTKRFNGWTNRDTYLYSLTIDDSEYNIAYNKIVKISKRNVDFKIKKDMLIEVLNNTGNKLKVNTSNVNFEEVIETYKRETK